jgi:hypothetical protein
MVPDLQFVRYCLFLVIKGYNDKQTETKTGGFNLICFRKKTQHFITNSRNGFCHMHVRHPTAKQEINNISQTVNLVPSYAILTRVTLINQSN